MPKAEQPRQEKKKGLTDKELVAKYEAGAQPVDSMLLTLLSKPAKNAPPKVQKRP